MLSSKIVRYRLLGAYYREDMCERYGRVLPSVVRRLYWQVHPQTVARNLIFIHVPRVAGMSISAALFGGGHTGHDTIRAYRDLSPELFATADSFALMRDPVDRFWSGYHFVRHSGAAVVGLSRAFRQMTRHVETVDDYLDFLDGKSPLALDFVMRPQAWFLTDLKTGRPLVKNIFLLGRDDEALAQYLASYGVGEVPRLNGSLGAPAVLTPAQRARVERIYADDFKLIAALPRPVPARAMERQA